jgi:hypothetical protein
VIASALLAAIGVAMVVAGLRFRQGQWRGAARDYWDGEKLLFDRNSVFALIPAGVFLVAAAGLALLGAGIAASDPPDLLRLAAGSASASAMGAATVWGVRAIRRPPDWLKPEWLKLAEQVRPPPRTVRFAEAMAGWVVLAAGAALALGFGGVAVLALRRILG